MARKRLIRGYPPMKRIQILLTVMVTILALTGAGLLFLLSIDCRVARNGRRLATFRLQDDPDCIIVPGAPYFPDGKPGLMLADRLDSALRLYHDGQVRRILISGDHGADAYDEIQVMTEYLIAGGVAPGDLFCDHAGFDTYETLIRARDLFGVRQALITTQTYHLLRALYIGDKLGLRLTGVACDDHIYPSMPMHRLREVVARFKAWLDCEVLHSRPLLNEAIRPAETDRRQAAGTEPDRPATL